MARAAGAALREKVQAKAHGTLIRHAVHAHALAISVAQRVVHHTVQAVHVLRGESVAQKRFALAALRQEIKVAFAKRRKRGHEVELLGEHVAKTVFHQVILIREVMVKRLLAHACQGNDLGNAYLIKRLLLHKLLKRAGKLPLRFRHFRSFR